MMLFVITIFREKGQQKPKHPKNKTSKEGMMMNLVKWNPWIEMDVFHDRMNRLFNGPYFPALPSSGEFDLTDWRPVVDIFEEGDSIVIKADLPGVDKDHIEVDLKDRVLTLKGERSHENEIHLHLVVGCWSIWEISGQFEISRYLRSGCSCQRSQYLHPWPVPPCSHG